MLLFAVALPFDVFPLNEYSGWFQPRVIEVFWLLLLSSLESGAAHAVPARLRVATTAPRAKMRLLLTYFLLGAARSCSRDRRSSRCGARPN